MINCPKKVTSLRTHAKVGVFVKCHEDWCLKIIFYINCILYRRNTYLELAKCIGLQDSDVECLTKMT